MSEWTLAIDYGTTYTAAAVARRSGIELLYFNGVPRIPSLVLRKPDGELVVGTTAENETLISPDRVLRAPKRRLGDRMVLLGDAPLAVVDAVSAVLSAVADEARRQQGGTDPDRVVMTHPARWGSERLAALSDAARRAGLPDPEFIPEPVAAALHYMATGDEEVEPGRRVAVYDLGGGTFDTAVLERKTDGGFDIVATGGNEYLGGEDFDEIVYRHFGGLLAEEDAPAWEQLRHSEDRPWKKANAEFRRDVRQLKEDLSTTNARSVYIRYPVDRELQLTRTELEGLLRPELERTLDELTATIQRAGSAPKDLAAIYLVGGSSRIRLLPQLVRDRFGRADTRDDPKAVVALGAARAEKLQPAAEVPPPDAAMTPSATDVTVVPPATAAAPIRPEFGPVKPPTRPQRLAPVPPPAVGPSLPLPPAVEDQTAAARSEPAPLIQRLRRPSIVAAALAGLAILAIAVYVSANLGSGSGDGAGASPLPSGLTWAENLQMGDCFNPGGAGTGDEGLEQVEVVPCDEGHRYEVHHTFEYSGAGDTYPNTASLERQGRMCAEAAEEFLGAPAADLDLQSYLLYPLEDQWAAGDRAMTCTIRRPGGTGSMSASQADAGVASEAPSPSE